MRALTVKVLDESVGGVRFEANTIISVDNGAVQDVDGIASVDIPSICILRLLATRLYGVQVDIVEGDVAGSIHQVVPKWTLDLLDVFNMDILSIVYHPRNRSRPASLICSN